MGSYSIDNATAMQGRYADIVTTSQSLQPNYNKARNSANVDSKNKARDFNQENIQKTGDSSEEKVWSLSDDQDKKEELLKDEEKMNSITEVLNEFMAQWNAQLRFSVHKETSYLTVKFVDMKNNKVLKEFPPEEYLDMIGKIRKFIGTMIDEKV